MPIRLLTAIVFAFGALVPSVSASAQTIARSFDALRAEEKPGRLVRLLDTHGQQTIGRIAEISSSAIALDVKDHDGTLERVTFAEQDVRQIRHKRSHWIGPVSGLVSGITAAVLLCRRDEECGSGSRGFQRSPKKEPRQIGRDGGAIDDHGVSPMHVSGPLMLAAITGGPALGRLLDRPGTERILYRAPEPPRSPAPAAPRP